ncbi:MAG: choice-of-anchor B family protein [Saprospiraceae bacterium]|nr:choice-of-anchor B family protein [Saprospiraceae bacterium]
MKSLLASLCILLASHLLLAQAEEATMLYNWHNDDITPTSWLGSRYNDIWGVEVNGQEFAIMGGTDGVHFFNVTEGADSEELPDAFVPGTAGGSNLVHRDYHAYNGYLYTVADEGSSTLQIIDISDLPNSTTLVYNESDLIRRAHNVFIEESQARLYACGVSVGSTNYALSVLSLDDPTSPVVLGSFPNANLSIPYVHDIYVKDNIAYLNCGTSGFYVVDFTDTDNPVLLGTMTDYEQQGYNHSGWLHPDGQYYYLADETHGKDLKVVDVSDFSDIHVVSTFSAESGHPSEIAHNLIVRDDKLYVSYYYDGLQVFDLSNPAAPVRIAYYDTYDQPNDASYRGAWGVYPLLPSGNVLLSDMHNGLFLFEKIEYTPVSAQEIQLAPFQMNVFPNPAQESVTLAIQSEAAVDDLQINLYDFSGRLVKQLGQTNLLKGQQQVEISLGKLPAGLFQLGLEGSAFRKYVSLTVAH